MPYENEHACRLMTPEKGAPTRRVNGERKHDGKPYDVIYQKKGKDWKEQAYRYPVEDWTSSSARSHCKSHKGILFEPAKGKSKNMDEDENIQMQWDGCDTVPAKACNFVLEDSVCFADENQSDMVKLVGYRGEIIKHWFWGNFAVDMKGLSWDKKKTPGLIDHNTNQRLTFSKEKSLDPEVFIAGPFLNNPDAETMKMDMKKGFPFQASMALRPAVIEQVFEDKSVQVNGKQLKGPGAIFRRAKIMEISAVVFGAFSNTESTEYRDGDKQYQFELTEKEITMAKSSQAEILELSTEKVKTEFEDIYNEILKEGRSLGIKSEIDRFNALKTACGDDNELLVGCFAEGLTTAAAQAKRIEKVSAELNQARQKVQELTEASQNQKIDPAVTEFNNQPGAQNQTEKFDESKATDEQLKEHFAKTRELQDIYSRAEAYIAAVRHPAKK